MSPEVSLIAHEAPQEDPLQAMAKRLGVADIAWMDGVKVPKKIEVIYSNLEGILRAAKDRDELRYLPSPIRLQIVPDTPPLDIVGDDSNAFCVINALKTDDEITAGISAAAATMRKIADVKEGIEEIGKQKGLKIELAYGQSFKAILGFDEILLNKFRSALDKISEADLQILRAEKQGGIIELRNEQKIENTLATTKSISLNIQLEENQITKAISEYAAQLRKRKALEAAIEQIAQSKSLNLKLALGIFRYDDATLANLEQISTALTELSDTEFELIKNNNVRLLVSLSHKAEMLKPAYGGHLEICICYKANAEDIKTYIKTALQQHFVRTPAAVQTAVAERVDIAAPKTIELNGVTYTLGAEKTIDTSEYPIFEATDPEGEKFEIAFVPKDQGIVPANRKYVQDKDDQSIYISSPLPSPTERIDGYDELVRVIGEDRSKFAPTIKAIIEHHLKIAIEEANKGRTIVKFKYALAPNLDDPKPLCITLDVQPGEAEAEVNTNLAEQNQKTCLAQFFQWYKINKLEDVLTSKQIGYLSALEKADAPATRHSIMRGFLQPTTDPQAAPAPTPPPIAPSEPVAPVAPSEPVAPVAPSEPVAPVAPSEPVTPVTPVTPVAPVAPVAPNPFRRFLPWVLGAAGVIGTAGALSRGDQEKPVAPTPPGITATMNAQVTQVVSEPQQPPAEGPPSQPPVAPATGSWLEQRF